MEATALITAAAFVLAGHVLWSARPDQAARVGLQAGSELLVAGDITYSPPWIVERLGGNRYVLRNAGDAAEYDVRATFPDNPVNPHVLEHARVGPGAAVPFTFLHTAGAPCTITVTWSRIRRGVPEQLWTGTVPARPDL